MGFDAIFFLRISDLQFSFHQSESPTNQSPILPKSERPNTSQMTLSLTKTVSFDNREELHQDNPLKNLTSDEIVTENLINEQLTDTKSNDTILKTQQDKGEINLVKFSECDILVKETALCENQNQSIVDTTPTTNVSSLLGMTPTIPIVVCTVSDSEPKCAGVKRDNITDTSSDKQIGRHTNVFNSATDKKSIPQEELSPTTDEYQECCIPANYQYDISTEGEMLARGCVAPAPTPAPSIAPLAEVEVDPPEDELDAEEMESVHGSETQGENATSEVKKIEKHEDGSSVVVGKDVIEQGEETQCRNPVCPWEDE